MKLILFLLCVLIAITGLRRASPSAMSNPPPDQRPTSDDGDNPTTKQIERIATAFEARTRDQKAADAKNAKHDRKVRRWTRAATIGAMIYTLITVGIFILTIRSIREAGRAADAATAQAKTAEDTEKRQLRAYVAMSGISIQAVNQEGPGGAILWTVSAIWENSGATPTRSLVIRSEFSVNYTGISIGSRGNWPATIGPRDETIINMGTGARASEWSQILAKGIASYKDVFEHPHITMSCRIAQVQKGIVKDLGVIIKLQSMSCPKGGNCADQDCQRYKAEIGDAVPQSAYDP